VKDMPILESESPIETFMSQLKEVCWRLPRA